MPDDQKLPPPSGDSQRAENYVSQLANLISEDKLRVTHTDLSKFDPSSLHDHYSLDLKDYQVEVSHSKQPTTGRDSYVILFNNIKNIEANQTQKEILAYLIITEEQFKKLKDVADEQIETLKKIDEEKRFKTAMTGVDKLLAEIAKGEIDLTKTPQPVPLIPNEEQTTTLNNLPVEEAESEKAEVDPSSNLTEPTQTPAIATPDTKLSLDQSFGGPNKLSTNQPLSPLAQAEALPLPTESQSPAPIVEEVDQNGAPAPIEPAQPPTPLPPETTTSGSQNPLNSSSAQPTPTIEEVQKALAEAYAKAPQTPPPAEYRPNLGETTTPITNAFTTSINTLPSESTSPNSGQIDQAINQAFRPADNSLLTH